MHANKACIIGVTLLCETQIGTHIQHGLIIAQHIAIQNIDTALAGIFYQQAHQRIAEAFALMVLSQQDRIFRLCPICVGNQTRNPDDGIWIRRVQRNECHLSGIIDLGQAGRQTLWQQAHWVQEAKANIFRGGPGDQMFAMHITQQADTITGEGFLQALAVVLLVITLITVAVAGRFLGFEFIWGGNRQPAPKLKHIRTPEKRPRGLRATAADRIGWPVLRLMGHLNARWRAWTVRIVGGLIVATLVLPIVVVMIISFSKASYLTFPPPDYSLRWYEKFFSDRNWMSAFWNSLGIAVISAGISVTLGAAAAMGIVRSTIRHKSTLMLLLVSPMIVPPVVLGLSLYSLFLKFDMVGTYWGLAAAHSINGIPIVVVIVAASLQGVDRQLEQSAAVHGASPLTVFRTVTLPAIAPGIGAAVFFAFLHSFDELVLTLFLSSPRMKTLPLMLWGDINYQLNPVLAVVSTLEVLLVVGGIILARPVLTRAR